MKRREFIKHGATGLAVVAVGSMLDWPRFWRGSQALAASAAGFADLTLEMIEVDAEMADQRKLPMWAFRLMADNGDDDHDVDHASIYHPRIPGPALVALEGDRIKLRIINDISLGGAHGFAIPGVTLTVNGQSVQEVSLQEDESVEVEFIAPAPGTYMYLDPLNAPVNRVMGLHGALVVLPQPVGWNGTPYSNPTTNIRNLFRDLGTTPHFAGHPWNPERNAIWIFNTIDPDKCAAVDRNDPITPAAFLNGFLPQYFTLNGKSGFFSAHHHHALGDAEEHHHHDAQTLSFFERSFDLQNNISVMGRIGEPIVIRSMNAGLAWHSPHIHGNHIYQLTDNNGVPQPNLLYIDTWTVQPLARVDVLLPFIIPPDIPREREVVSNDNQPMGRLAWPPVQEKFPLVYPMHDHNEISNTTAGGNYPHGLVTHWQIDGDINPAAFVIFVDKADLRVRTGTLELRGRISRTPAQVGAMMVMLMVHAGGIAGDMLGHAMVDAQGNWAFRGRGLKIYGSRIVTLMYHDPEDPAVMHASRTVPLRVI